MNSLSERKKSVRTRSAMYEGPTPLVNCCAFLLLAVAAWILIGMAFAWITS